MASGLCFRYTRGCRVLQHLDIAVPPGTVHSVLGRSGCGKTTLLRLIAGLERPECGTISIDGRVVSDRDGFVPPERRGVGVVFQDLALFPTKSVRGNVAFGMRSVARRDRRAACETLLEQVGLGGLGSRMPHTLSGGQQQRVALARALAAKPRVMLLDEPFSGLDAELRESVRNELIAVLRNAHVATLLVTHDAAEAHAVSDEVSVLGCDGEMCSSSKDAGAVPLAVASEIASGIESSIDPAKKHQASEDTSRQEVSR